MEHLGPQLAYGSRSFIRWAGRAAPVLAVSSFCEEM